MSTRTDFIVVDDPCATAAPHGTDCDGTLLSAKFVAVSLPYSGFFDVAGTTNAPGGITTDYPSWVLEEPISGETLGPVYASNKGSFATWAIATGPFAGVTLAIDWTDITRPIISQITDLPSPITIQAAVTLKDECNNVKINRGKIGFADDPLVPAPLGYLKWTGDGSDVVTAGEGTDIPVSSGFFNNAAGQLKEDDGTTNLVPGVSYLFYLTLRDSQNNQIINEWSFDYSAAIDFTTDSPLTATDPLYTRTGGSTTTITWADIQPHIQAGSGIDAVGAVVFDLHRMDFARAVGLVGCFIASPGDSVPYQLIGTVNANSSKAPASTIVLLQGSADGRFGTPFAVVEDSQTGYVYAGLTVSTLDELAELRDVGGSLCLAFVDSVRDEIESVIGGPISGSSSSMSALRVDTNRGLVNGRDVLVGLFAKTGTPALSDVFYVMTWNPTLGAYDVTGTLMDAVNKPLSEDSTHLVNSRSIFWNENQFIYYTGTGEVYARNVFAASPWASTSSEFAEVDPVTGVIYAFFTSGASGLQNFHKLTYTAGDPLLNGSWTGAQLGFYEDAIDVDGPLNAASGTPGTCGFIVTNLFYTGNRVNSEPEFYLGDSTNAKIKRLFYNGAAWEVETLGGTGVSAVTDGDMSTVAEFDFPQGFFRRHDGQILITSRLGNALRLWDDAGTDAVSTIYGPTIASAQEDLYF